MRSLVTTTISNDAGFFRYLQEIRNIPSLALEEEYDLAKRLTEHKDVAAAHKLVTSHLKLVTKIAYNFRGYKLPMMDLVSEGNIGLMHAVKKFDPSLGFRLSTYATWWIKASIQEYILKSWSLVKMGTTAAQKKLFFNLGKIKRKLQQLNNGLSNKQSVTAIANELQVGEKEVIEMQSRMQSMDMSLNSPVVEGQDGDFIDLLPENRANQEVVLGNVQEMDYKKKLLKSAMDNLSERERNILSERHLKEDPATLEDLSQAHNISRERVRQIESRALEKITQFIQGNAVFA